MHTSNMHWSAMVHHKSAEKYCKCPGTQVLINIQYLLAHMMQMTYYNTYINAALGLLLGIIIHHFKLVKCTESTLISSLLPIAYYKNVDVILDWLCPTCFIFHTDFVDYSNLQKYSHSSVIPF